MFWSNMSMGVKCNVLPIRFHREQNELSQLKNQTYHQLVHYYATFIVHNVYSAGI